MAVKLRLQRHGRGKRPFYHIVATDSRARRDGRYIERIGDYNPLTKPATINVDVDKAVDWLQKGAEATDTVNAILKYKGVLVKKHLMRGVAKGAFTLEAAEEKFQQWLGEHKNAVLDHQKKHHKDKAEINAKLLAEETKKREARDQKRADALAAAQAATAAENAEATEDAQTEVTATEEIVTEEVVTEEVVTEEVQTGAATTEAPAVEETKTEAPVVEETPTVEAATEAPAETIDTAAAETEATDKPAE